MLFAHWDMLDSTNCMPRRPENSDQTRKRAWSSLLDCSKDHVCHCWELVLELPWR